MLLVLSALGAIAAGAAYLAMRWSLRAPRCRECGTEGDLMADRLLSETPLMVQSTFWCPTCATVIGRRLVGPLWE